MSEEDSLMSEEERRERQWEDPSKFEDPKDQASALTMNRINNTILYAD